MAALATEAGGVYEDGWVSAAGFIAIEAPAKGKVGLRGEVPQGLALTAVELTVTAAGQAIARRALTPGPFELDVPVQPRRTELDFRFSAASLLPRGDGRNVSARLLSLKFDPDPADRL